MIFVIWLGYIALRVGLLELADWPAVRDHQLAGHGREPSPDHPP